MDSLVSEGSRAGQRHIEGDAARNSGSSPAGLRAVHDRFDEASVTSSATTPLSRGRLEPEWATRAVFSDFGIAFRSADAESRFAKAADITAASPSAPPEVLFTVRVRVRETEQTRRRSLSAQLLQNLPCLRAVGTGTWSVRKRCFGGGHASGRVFHEPLHQLADGGDRKSYTQRPTTRLLRPRRSRGLRDEGGCQRMVRTVSAHSKRSSTEHNGRGGGGMRRTGCGCGVSCSL